MNDDDDLVFLNHEEEDENAVYLTEQQREYLLNEDQDEDQSEMDLETTIRLTENTTLTENKTPYWQKVFG